jgi:hypothetical protein
MIIGFYQILREFNNRKARPDVPEDIKDCRQLPLIYGCFRGHLN